jgi:hypothetical protein
MEPGLVIGTPCFGRQLTDVYVTSLLKLQMACLQRRVRLKTLLFGGDALITRVRQNILSHFLADESNTHLLFIDADIGFESEQVFRLMQFNAPITAAIYPLKRLDWEKVAACVSAERVPLRSAALTYLVEFHDPERVAIRDEFARVDYAGTGFFMIQRPALLAMIERYPELRYTGEHKPDDSLRESPWRYALFNCLIDETTGTYLSEDFAFCRRWTAMGGEIWVDLKSRLTHLGSVDFSGDLSTQLSLVTSESP